MAGGRQWPTAAVGPVEQHMWPASLCSICHVSSQLPQTDSSHAAGQRSRRHSPGMASPYAPDAMVTWFRMGLPTSLPPCQLSKRRGTSPIPSGVTPTDLHNCNHHNRTRCSGCSGCNSCDGCSSCSRCSRCSGCMACCSYIELLNCYNPPPRHRLQPPLEFGVVVVVAKRNARLTPHDHSLVKIDPQFARSFATL